ncbi:tail fiber protein [Flavobacterium sp. KACC 22758]|uniref:tail fiber protein n=1 Tax=Flavobacterium sp. KACC 22758 TaxID=3025667 RepID=UPI002366ECAF|nr:tail fiber protein [Flavobacterium sp. KACC 22758]WDF59576.1 tail fiber protein [Flavobacterium sp. KACC 22758]
MNKKMNRKIALLAFIMSLIITNVKSQTLNPSYVLDTPGAADTFLGGYTFSYIAAGTPWNGALISFGGAGNNYDCQISSDYQKNRISFRTRNGDYSNSWNPWNELATTLGDNSFSGNQNIAGSLGISTSVLTSPLTVGEFHGVKLSVGGTTWASNKILYTSWISGIGDFTEINVVGKYANNASIRLIENGNVGIGANNPDSKLTVAGNIHAQEVKVTVNAGVVPDYVFANDYKLKPLNEVEHYIKQNSHLPEIPSAQEIEKNGLMLAEMNMNLLKKIEEMTLYMITQSKELDNQKTELEVIKSKLLELEKK